MLQINGWMMDGFGRGYGHYMGGRDYGFYNDYDFFGPTSLLTLSFFSIIFLLAVLWTVAIKGYALWYAAKRGEKWWFIAILLINTFGIFELFYLYFIAKVSLRQQSSGLLQNSKQDKNSVQDHSHSHSHTDGSSHGHGHEDKKGE